MTGRGPGHRPLAGLFQIAYVTTDLDRALAVFGEDYGMTEFARMSALELRHGSGETLTIEVGLAWIDDVQIEIVEPRGGRDGIYRDALENSSSDVVMHHLGIRLPTREAVEQQRAQSLRHGQEIALSGEIEGVSAFFYADARATAGHYLEYLYLSPERLAFHRAMPRF